MKKYHFFLPCTLLIFLFFFLPICKVDSQPNTYISTNGEKVTRVAEAPQEFVYTSKRLFKAFYPLGGQLVFIAPDGVDIIGVVYKSALNLLIVLLSNGTVVTVDSYTHLIHNTYPNNGLTPGIQTFNKLAGDDIYVLTQGIYSYFSSIYKSSNNGQTFVIDTTGLNGAHLYDITVDTFQNIYAAGTIGIYSQTLTGTTWTKNINYPGSYCNVIFADHRGRLFAATNNRLYKSINSGSSFTLDTAGIGTKRVTSMGDDKSGNIYVVINSSGSSGSGDRLYRSDGGTAAFVRIDMPISALNGDPLNPNIYNTILGDSILFTTTIFGSFRSTDLGVTWTEDNKGNVSDHYYGLVKANDGRLLTTTNLGCFKQSAVDTIWNKVYPASPYAPGQAVFKDNSGNLYTQGAVLFGDVNYKTRMVVKSTDNGATWLPDTLGIYKMIMATWFVDENGVQHASQTNFTSPIQLFSKQPGQSWVPDNAGHTSPNNAQSIIFGSNGAGKIYFSQTDNVLWSKQGAANWIIDTIGLGSTGAAVYSFANNSAHQTYLGTYNNGIGTVWKQSGSGWMKLNNPGGTQQNAFAITVDAHDRLWAAYSYFDGNYNAIGYEVDYSINDGVNWLQPNFQIDTVTFRQLVAIGDSVYGLSYYNGAYLFRVPSASPSSSGIPPSLDSVAITYTPLSNASGTPAPPYYTNFLPSANTTATIYRGDRFELSLKVNNSGSPYNIGVWADYNNDNIFDPGENVLLSSRTASIGSNWIQVPLTVSATTARLRIRVSTQAITANDCCSALSNGEAEDYTLSLNQVLNCRWIGRTSTDWHDASNWSCGQVPDNTKSVLIPTGTPFNCEVVNANASVDRIWIQTGATITVKSPRTLAMKGNNTLSAW